MSPSLFIIAIIVCLNTYAALPKRDKMATASADKTETGKEEEWQLLPGDRQPLWVPFREKRDGPDFTV